MKTQKIFPMALKLGPFTFQRQSFGHLLPAKKQINPSNLLVEQIDRLWNKLEVAGNNDFI